MALYYHELGMDDMTLPVIISFEDGAPEGWIPVYCYNKGKEYRKPLFYGTATVEEILDIIESIHPEYAIYAGEEPDPLERAVYKLLANYQYSYGSVMLTALFGPWVLEFYDDCAVNPRGSGGQLASYFTLYDGIEPAVENTKETFRRKQ